MSLWLLTTEFSLFIFHFLSLPRKSCLLTLWRRARSSYWNFFDSPFIITSKIVHVFIHESFRPTRTPDWCSWVHPLSHSCSSVLPWASRVSCFLYFSNVYKIAYIFPVIKYIPSFNAVCSLIYLPVLFSFTFKFIKQETKNCSCFLYIALFLIPLKFDSHVYQFTRIVSSKKNYYTWITKFNRLSTIIISNYLPHFTLLFLSSWNSFLPRLPHNLLKFFLALSPTYLLKILYSHFCSLCSVR